MFTPEIQEKTLENGRLKVKVLFKNEDESKNFTRELYAGSDIVLATNIRAEIQNAESAESLHETISVGNVDEAFYEVSATREQTNREMWFALCQKWARVKALLVDTGVLTLSTEEVSGLLSEVKKGYRPEYLDFV